MSRTDELIQKDIQSDKVFLNTSEKIVTTCIKVVGWLFISTGILLCLSIIGIFAGVLMIISGFLLLKFGHKVIRFLYAKEGLKVDIKQSQLDDRRN
jgi:uncharacterized membrane protein